MTTTSSVTPLAESNDALADPATLRTRLSRDGYLFFRGLAPRARVLDLRRQILEFCKEAGWLDAKADLMDARWSGVGPYAENEAPYMQVYRRIVHLPLFNDLPRDPAYMGLMERILGGTVLNHRMHIGRVSFPNNPLQTTPPHQDFHYIAGTPETYTIWTPLGETPLDLGGLAVLRGSHRGGYLEHVEFPGQKYAAFGLGDDRLPHDDVEWRASAYHPGDCIVFHSHTVHKAMPNVTGTHLRLSMDNRYQRQGEATGPAAHRTHHDL
ncbi:MAG: phytanoyl-CoA dioxygenase family protein [Planctomycetota bacterium]|nr:phytanoyl-CoA dioxygenase family protein [Planctomycetota bacterium]